MGLKKGVKTHPEKILKTCVKQLQRKKHLEILKKSLINSSPVLAIKQIKRRKKKVKEFPFILKKNLRLFFGLKFLLSSLKLNKNNSFSSNFSDEILLTSLNKSNTVKLKKDLYEQSFQKKNMLILDGFKTVFVRLIGVEPIIFGTEIQRFIQLSYKRKKKSFMIQQQTILKVADNSGAKTVKCIKVLGGFKKKIAKLGDIIIVSIQTLRNKSKLTSKVSKGEIYKALIVRTKKKYIIKNGFTINFNENSVSLLNKQKKPIGTRIIGPLSKRLKNKKFSKL